MKKPIPVSDFLHLVKSLSNTCFVRHWMAWLDQPQGEYSLALCCIDWEGQPRLPYRGDIEGWDFITDTIGVNTIFRFRRAEEDSSSETAFLRHLVDTTWQYVLEDEQVPSTALADKLIANARRDMRAQQPSPPPSLY